MLTAAIPSAIPVALPCPNPLGLFGFRRPACRSTGEGADNTLGERYVKRYAANRLISQVKAGISNVLTI